MVEPSTDGLGLGGLGLSGLGWVVWQNNSGELNQLMVVGLGPGGFGFSECPEVTIHFRDESKPPGPKPSTESHPL